IKHHLHRLGHQETLTGNPPLGRFGIPPARRVVADNLGSVREPGVNHPVSHLDQSLRRPHLEVELRPSRLTVEDPSVARLQCCLDRLIKCDVSAVYAQLDAPLLSLRVEDDLLPSLAPDEYPPL